MTNTKYLSCAETAKLLRAALKESFPKQKFSVKSRVYSGGASIDVKWMDGPTAASVEPILSMFKGAYFDGMIDYQGSRYHSLDGQPVSFGSSFVFGARSLTKALAEAVAAKVAERYGRSDWTEVCGSEAWGYRVMQMPNGPRITDAIEQAEKELGAPEALPSATLARIKITGDDGYGAGTVGPEGKGGESCYKAIHAAQESARAAEAAVAKTSEQLADELVAEIERAAAQLIARMPPASAVLQ